MGETMQCETRYVRNRDIVDQEAINRFGVTIVGVGAIGSALAEQLAKLGVRRLTLIDPDVVSEVNLSVQGFYESEVGLAKVDAVADRLRAIRGGIEVAAHAEAWRPASALIAERSVVFATVDSIAVRRELFDEAFMKGRAPCLFDARMTAEFFETHCVPRDGPEAIQAYRRTFFASAQAHRESCTARSTIYCASIAAGVLCAMFKSWSSREQAGFHTSRFDLNIRTFDAVASQLRFV